MTRIQLINPAGEDHGDPIQGPAAEEAARQFCRENQGWCWRPIEEEPEPEYVRRLDLSQDAEEKTNEALNLLAEEMQEKGGNVLLAAGQRPGETGLLVRVLAVRGPADKVTRLLETFQTLLEGKQ